MTRSIYGTIFLFILICLVYGIELATGLHDQELYLLNIGGLSDNGKLHGQGWRLVTYAFLHSSALHVGFNCCLLLFAGPRLERRIGTLKFLLIFLMSSVLGGIALLVKGAIWPTLDANLGASYGMIGLLIAHIVLTRRVPAQA